MKKQKIYSIQCQCGAAGCLLKGDQLKTFQNRCAVKQVKRHRDNTQKSTYTDCIELMAYDEHLNILNKKSTCAVLKEYIKMNASYKFLTEVNHEWKENTEAVIKEKDRLSAQNLKLKVMFEKNLGIMQDKMNVIKNRDNTIKDQQNEIRQLKKKNKHLLNAVTDLKFTQEEVLEREQEQDECSRTTDYILSAYESIKAYMILHNTSIGSLCRKNNKDPDNYTQVFVNIRCLRNNVAHPKGKIKDDLGFFETIENF